MKTTTLAMALLLMLSGCAANKPYTVSEETTYGSIGSATTITIIDERPEADSAFSYGSMMVFNLNYGIWTLGDKQFSPELTELLKTELYKALSAKSLQPQRIEITLERMIVQSNHQADLLQSSSTSGGLGPLGVLIAEGMHGKKFELDYDKTRPFVMGLIKAEVDLSYSTGSPTSKSILVSKVKNFSNHMDARGREEAAVAVVKNLMQSFSSHL